MNYRIEGCSISLYYVRTAFPEWTNPVHVVFSNTEYQRCIVHQVRNTLKYVSEKDKKAFATDLKKIYHAASEEQGYKIM